ncbi:TonB-dependent receptor, partial [bacterium]|nr:TonB-dependent receptor [bacterium]
MKGVFTISARLLVLLIVFRFISPYAAAQTGSGLLQGQVIDALTKEALSGASLVVLGAATGTSSDADGRFIIGDLEPDVYRLQATYIGYKPEVKTDIIISPGKQVELLIEMEQSAEELSEVVIQPSYFSSNSVSAVSTQSLTNEEIRRAPGGNEDVVRAIAVLPGVVQTSAGRNDLIVRGGAPSENLYIVDGHKVPNINHFGTQGATGGPLSFVNLDFVRDITFSTGGFGVQYGDRLSSLLELEIEDGRTDRVGGKATISASQFGADLEGPLGARGSFILSARRSYLDFIFRSAGFGFVPEYWDFLGKATYNIDQRNKISFLNIGALDRVRFFNDTEEQRFDNSRILGNSQDQYFSGISWQHLLKGAVLRTSLTRTFTDYKFGQSDSLQNPIFKSDSREGETGLSSDLIVRVTPQTALTMGAELKTADLDGTMLLRDFESSFGDSLIIPNANWDQRATKSAAFFQLDHKFSRKLTGTLGGRWDYFDRIDKKSAFSPRGSLSYDITDKTIVSLSGGVYHQAPSYVWLTTNGKNRQLEFIRANQLVFGVERLLRSDTRIRLESYVKQYRHYPASLTRPYLVLANTGAGFGGSEEGFSSFGFDDLVSEGRGLSRGIELLLQKRLSDLCCYGIVSATYGKTEFKGVDGVKRPGLYDQRFIFNLSGGYQPSIKWEFSAKFRIGTGTPYTPYDSQGGQSVETYNTERLPLFH